MKLIYSLLLLTLLCQESFTQITYSSLLKSDFLRLSQFDGGNLVSTGFLEHEGLSLNDEDAAFGITYLRAYLNKSGLSFINEGSWLSSQLYNSLGGSGVLDLYAGGGTGLNFSAGPDALNPTRGRLFLYDSGNARVDLRIFDSGGIVQTKGQNSSNNAGLSFPSGRPNVGYIFCQDDAGQIQAGLIVAQNGTGEVFGDTKNFRMEHPEQPGKEIWYASLEGPEAAAYERGSSELRYGEAFIPFSDHFQLVINPETMTIILTPHSADTYGLAVVEKTAKGFRVKELKGGKGHFGFDWEAKAVRKGYEDYRVIRDARDMLPMGERPGQSIGTSAGETQDNTATEDSETQPQELPFQLGQNQPNPTNGKTFIPYSIPDTVKSAELQLFDVRGKLVQQYSLSPEQDGRLEIPVDSLSPGMYTYSLVIDGSLKGSRQMVISR
jgi:hypothetical protein